jgi:hypothetical protein
VWRRAVALVNARVVTDEGIASSIRFSTRVLGIEAPRNAATSRSTSKALSFFRAW